jgi:dGTPase
LQLVREILEDRERQFLSPLAQLSSESKGRRLKVKECKWRTGYQRDRDRILHSKSFRRLKHKTQVFIAPAGDHYRTRLTHTLEVSHIARTVARALFLNEDLVEAIALGHDLGHTPFGHSGEEVLNRCYPKGFRHNEQSLRVADILERDGQGLNLTFEVRDGILNHTGRNLPKTLEGQIVRLADRIAYVSHDIDDSVRAGIITQKDIPKHLVKVLGSSHGQVIDSMVAAMIEGSRGRKKIAMTVDVYHAMMDLRKFLFKKVYIDSVAKTEESKTRHLIETLYAYYVQNNKPRAVVDFIASMTDRFAIAKFNALFVPSPWTG